MTAHLHELLAAEKTATNARDQLAKETLDKFNKGDSYFSGFTKTLDLHDGETPNKDQIESAARQDKALPTTVLTTLDYFFQFWSKAEDVLYSKNVTNTKAVADLVFRDKVIAEKVPVDELMGLEVRLTDLRKLATQIPTLDASKDWEVDTKAAQGGTWKGVHPIKTTRTEKITVPVVLYAATKEHPAQVKESNSDKVIGTFTQSVVSGSTTAIQKANMLSVLDDLIIATKQSRTRANSVEVQKVSIGKTITDLIMAPLLDAPINNQV